MNDFHLHMMANHLPTVLPAVGLVVVFVAFLLRSAVAQRFGYGIIVCAALSAPIAGSSGERIEHEVEGFEGVAPGVVHEHEEAVEQFVPVLFGLGALSLVALIVSWRMPDRRKLQVGLMAVALILGSVVMGLAYRAGETGGLIRHPEIADHWDRGDGDWNGDED